MTTRPVHDMITPTVTIPTVSVRELKVGDNGRRAVCIQWNGEASRNLPKDAQFLFESTAGPDDECWHGHPELFKVVFIGPVIKWPNAEVRQQVADMATGGNLDSDIVWMLCSEFESPEAVKRHLPASLMTTVVVLGDPNVGVIRPVHYYGEDVRLAEIAAARKKMSFAEQLAEDPSLELPAENVPWNNAPGGCIDCSRFEHSYDEKPAVPIDGTVHDVTYLCSCGRRWWQFNDYYHLWKHVIEPGEWDAVRREAILSKAGLLAEQ